MSASRLICCQINLQTNFGGGETYTAFLCRALDRLGVATRLYCHRKATFWAKLNLPASTVLCPIDDIAALTDGALPLERCWLLSHGPLPSDLASRLASIHILTAIAHMPPQGRARDRYEHCQLVFGVSGYVVEGLRDIGVPVWPMPLYGVADFQRWDEDDRIQQASCYEWDMRKGRDRIFGIVSPLLEPFRHRPLFRRKPGIAIGIVSRLTPIKQFPPLFDIVSPIIAKHDSINIEIFGAGGYASVRDLRHATRTIRSRVRFWGKQSNVAAVYRQLDYLLTGLPEKEALGLNVIEAQACDTPVLAIDAPPFSETVLNEQTGFLYIDPRVDGGASFATLLARIESAACRLHPAEALHHLARFSFDAFLERLRPIVLTMEEKLRAA